MTGSPSLRMAVRTDASSAIGTGHVFRCLALTNELRRIGGEVVYVCAETPGHLAGLLEAEGYDVRLIPDGLEKQDDAAATHAALSGDGPFDCLLVDHYGLDALWERTAGRIAPYQIAIDDLADRPHDVDLLIDYSHADDEGALYASLLPDRTRLALGADYILLRREFFERAPPIRDFGAVRRILVTLGGNDPQNTMELALDALNDPAFADIDIDITLGLSNPRLERIKALSAVMPNVTTHVQSAHMADLMAEADLCLGAGGMTSWERCYMGLPTIVMVLADNQRDFAARLERMGCARNLGDIGGLDVASLRAAVLEALADSSWRAVSARRMRALVDGYGVSRVLGLLIDELRPRGTAGVSTLCL